jgi:hypothetical protein
MEQNKDTEDDNSAWRSGLLALCRLRNVDYHGMELPHSMQGSPTIASLPEREKRGLTYWLLADPEATTIDLQPRLDRMIRGHDRSLPTITPSAKVVLVKEARTMTGMEMLMNQGFPKHVLQDFASAPTVKSEPDILFGDMAGNAFSGPVILMLIISILLTTTPKQIELYGINLDFSKPAVSSCAASDDADTDEVLRSILG